MNGEMRVEDIEATLRERARGMQYPPTPDVAGAVWQRLVREGAPGTVRGGRIGARRALAGFMAGLAVVVALVVAVPDARAIVGSFIGRVGSIVFVLQTPTPTVVAGTSVVDWTGATTLGDAQQQVSFPIRLPSYPPSLGKPDRVFVQDLAGPSVVLVWLQPGYPDTIRMVLYEMPSDTYAQRIISDSTVLKETSVDGEQALWLRGPHMLEFHDQQADPGETAPVTRRMVDGNMLVWERSGMSYILQGTMSMEEAARIGRLFIVMLDSPTPYPSLVPTATMTPMPTAEPLPNLAGATTLAEARKNARFQVKVPGYPPELGEPDKVYVQDLGDPVVVLVWLEAGSQDKVEMALYQLPSTVYGKKTLENVTLLQTTFVNGQPGEWVTGEHVLEVSGGAGANQHSARRLVSGDVLVWSEGDVTYRLETSLPLLEALRVAESLR